MSSPRPATKPTIAALAPNEPRNGPTIPRAPSYVKSAKKFAIPMMRTKCSADLFFINHEWTPAFVPQSRDYGVAGELTRIRDRNIEARTRRFNDLTLQRGESIRHSTFVLRHFTVRLHLSRRSLGEGGFVVCK